MIVINPLGSKLLVNRIKEEHKSTISLPTAKETGVKKGVILVKGQGSPHNRLSDVHVFDVVLYANSTPIPKELQAELQSTYGDHVKGDLEIIEYSEILATL